jgi:hypothetical protein
LGLSAMHRSVHRLFVAVLLALSFGARAHALASDPLPGDAISPPADVNLLLYYNGLTNAGVLEPVRGSGYDKDTRISLDIQVLRYIRTFTIDGMVAGVQAMQPYVIFNGDQVLGEPHLPPDGAPGRVELSHSGGFAQPSFGAFIYPVSRPASGTYVAAGFWIAPPIGNYDKYANLNFTENLWSGEIEFGGRTVLLGNDSAQSLAVELWGEGYFYGSNDNTTLAGIGGTAPASLSEQPSGEIRAYLPYQFYARSRATFTPGLYQSFGGKQVYTLADGSKIDAGTRTQETQLRFVLSSYLSPNWQILVNTEYDLVAHGAPLNRNIELRIATIF